MASSSQGLAAAAPASERGNKIKSAARGTDCGARALPSQPRRAGHVTGGSDLTTLSINMGLLISINDCISYILYFTLLYSFLG